MAPWFGSRHGSKTQSQHGDNTENSKPVDVNVTKSLLSQEDIELEYLNEISRLTREKEEARDEIERQNRDNEVVTSSLRESNETLQSKVAELEDKLSHATSVTQSISNDSKVDIEVGTLKAKLAQYNDTNRALHTKIQKLKQRRKDGEDDYSEMSSISSISRFSYQYTNPNKQTASSLAELQTKYDDQLAKNKELEEKLKTAEANKTNSEKLLDELKVESSDALTRHQEETMNIQNDLHDARQELIKLKATQSSNAESNNEMTKEWEKSQLKVLELEKEIADKNTEIEALQIKLQASKDLQSKLEQLQEGIEKYKEEVESKEKLIETLRNEKERSEKDLKEIESTLKESKDREEKMQEELDQLKTQPPTQMSKAPEIDSTQADKLVQTNELKAALDDLQRKFTDEAKLNASLKEQLKGLQNSDRKGKMVAEATAESKDENIIDESELSTDEVTQLRAQLKSKEEKLNSINVQMKKIEVQRDDASSTLQSIETALAETKLKNALQMEELDTLKLELQQQKQRNKELEEIQNTSMSGSKHGKRGSVDNSKLTELEKTVNKKNLQIRVLEVKTRDVNELTEKVKKLETELTIKTKDLEDIKTEKLDSTKRLETLEVDFAITQQKGAKTWEELEDLKEKYEIEQKVKVDLQSKLKKMDSIQQLVGETKRLSEATLKDRDKEIDKLKKQLTETTIAKGATEKKLIAYMNDTAAQESTRDLMRQELEDQLETENEKAKQLESLIVSKEESIGAIRAEFDLLIKSMELEMQKKRDLVTELNGEVLKISNQLAVKDRDLQFVKGELEDMQLRHDSEVARLNRELDTSVDKVELERLRTQNADLEQTILTLNQDMGKMRAMFVNQPTENSSEGTIKVLRERNEKLKKDLEKLSRKIYQMKKGRKEI